MTRTTRHEGRPTRRPRAFDTVSPFMIDETGWTREQILRIRARVHPVVFAERRTSIDTT